MASYGNKELTEQEVLDAFQLIDTNKSNNIQFLEICEYCCQFIDSAAAKHDPLEEETHHLMVDVTENNIRRSIVGNDIIAAVNGIRSSFSESDTAKEDKFDVNNGPLALANKQRNDPTIPSQSLKADLNANSSVKISNELQPVEERNNIAMDAMSLELEKQKNIADFVEVKYNTEQQLKDVLSI